MRRTVAPVGTQDCRDFRDTEMKQRGLDHHFGRKLHSAGPKLQALIGGFREGPQPAMKVSHRTAEKQPSQSRQQRIADIPVFPRHGPRFNTAEKTIPHHDVPTFPKLFQEASSVSEIIASVRIAHQHEPSPRRGDASLQSPSVALLRNVHHARTETSRNGL